MEFYFSGHMNPFNISYKLSRYSKISNDILILFSKRGMNLSLTDNSDILSEVLSNSRSDTILQFIRTKVQYKLKSGGSNQLEDNRVIG